MRSNWKNSYDLVVSSSLYIVILIIKIYVQFSSVGRLKTAFTDILMRVHYNTMRL